MQIAEQKEKELKSAEITIENLCSYNVTITPATNLFLLKSNLLKIESVITVISENNEMKILMEQKRKITKDILIQQKYLDRYNIAIDTLSELKDLEYYSKTFLEDNLQKITILFRKLHLPPEFTELKIIDKEIVICRPNSESPIHINQMSMGQRTSLALAILFQMHAVGENTPRILLLDEPISNLDDIHIMNMVDILRELLLNGIQLFITTASHEIAKYFEKKFAFLDDDLFYYKLKRNISETDGVGEVLIERELFKKKLMN